jgi:hypothetical protein
MPANASDHDDYVIVHHYDFTDDYVIEYNDHVVYHLDRAWSDDDHVAQAEPAGD